jgi:hypothetical protein
MDHGGQDRFYLDNPRGEWVQPEQLDAWLDELEAAHPDLLVNIIVESCFSGSFIDGVRTISAPRRVVIASTTSRDLAYASLGGAIFSDHLQAGLDSGGSLLGSFRAAAAAASAANMDQTAWLDDNGNGVPNDASDGQEAQRRGFSYAGTFDDRWPPHIQQASAPAVILRGSGEIRARILDDPDSYVEQAWVVVYPPSYRPPQAGEELAAASLPGAMLFNRGAGWWGVMYEGFRELGEYRIVIYARDSTGLHARPFALTAGSAGIFLPLLLR